jgi:hypothetical protein
LNNKEFFNFTYEEFDDGGENITEKNQDKIKFEMMVEMVENMMMLFPYSDIL